MRNNSYKCDEAIGNLISALAFIYNRNTNNKISIHKLYKYLIDWIYYGKYNKFFESLFKPLKTKYKPIWYSGFNYDKELLKELNTLKKNMKFYSDRETFLMSMFPKNDIIKYKNNDIVIDKCCKNDNKLQHFWDIYSQLYTTETYNRIRRLKQNINVFFNIDKPFYKNSYFLQSELPILNKLNKLNKSDIPINIYSKKGCNDIIKYLKNKYPRLLVNCIDCKNGNLNNCLNKTKNTKQKNRTKRKSKRKNKTKKRGRKPRKYLD